MIEHRDSYIGGMLFVCLILLVVAGCVLAWSILQDALR